MPLALSITLLLFAVSVVGSNGLLLGPIAPVVAEALPGTAAQAVLTASALCGLGTAAGALFLAPMADRLGQARALRLALAVLAAALALSAAAPGVIWLAAAQTLAGLAAGVALPAIYARAAEIAPMGREKQVLGLVLMGWTLSLVFGVSLAALLAASLGWRVIYAALATASLLVALVSPREGDAERQAGLPGGAWQALAVPGAKRALAGCALFMMAFYGLYAMLGTHLAEALHQPPGRAAAATLAYGLGFAAAVPFDGWLDRAGPTRGALVVFPLLCGVYAAMVPGSALVWGVIGLCAAWGVVNHLGLTLIVSGLAALDPSRRAALMGLYSCVTYLAVFAGTLMQARVYGLGGFAACAALSGVLVLMALPLMRPARSPAQA